jgi:hypothetical protein
MVNIECLYSIGRGDVKTLFIMFRDPQKEHAARKVIRSLQARNHIPRSMELLYLPDDEAIQTKAGEFSVLLLTLPIDSDESKIIAILARRFQERLDLALEEGPEMADAVAYTYTQVVMEHRLQ